MAEDVTARRVWDLPTRVFHWALVALVITSVVTGGEEGWRFAVHVASGHLILLMILFRWIWGFVGSPRSRFGDFLRPPGAIITYALGFLRGKPTRAIGHNPLGGLMVTAFLIVIPAILVTGLAAAREEGFGLVSPLSRFAPEALGDLHELLVRLLYVMIFAHIAAVFVDWWLTGENLIKAMMTGRKAGRMGESTELPLASRRRFILAALPVAAFGAWLLSGIQLGELAAAEEDSGGGQGRGEGGGGESGRGRGRGRGGDEDRTN